MNLTVCVDDARAWAAYSHAVMAEIAAHKRRGRLSPTLGSPADIEADLQAVLGAIARLPAGAEWAPLDLSAVRDLERWVYYGRVVWTWLDELRAEGLLATAPDEAAERFQRALISRVLDPAGTV